VYVVFYVTSTTRLGSCELIRSTPNGVTFLSQPHLSVVFHCPGGVVRILRHFTYYSEHVWIAPKKSSQHHLNMKVLRPQYSRDILRNLWHPPMLLRMSKLSRNRSDRVRPISKFLRYESPSNTLRLLRYSDSSSGHVWAMLKDLGQCHLRIKHTQMSTSSRQTSWNLAPRPFCWACMNNTAAPLTASPSYTGFLDINVGEISFVFYGASPMLLRI